MQTIQGRCFTNGELQASELQIDNGLIVAIDSIVDSAELPVIAPGFIDLQVNGAANVLLNATPDTTAIIQIDQTLKRLGTTAWLPTIVTDSTTTMRQMAGAVADSRKMLPSILGVHFEGPHINPEKKGVHDADYIRQPSAEELNIYADEQLGCRLLTVAPETLSLENIQLLRETGCVLSAGHTLANYAETKTAITAGVSGATHLFNAMTGLGSREPGVVGAILDSDIPYGMILDGEHVHPAMVRQAYAANQNMVLVTDAMPLLASDKTEFDWFGQIVRRDGARLIDQNGRLAGACISQQDALQNAMQVLDLSLSEALPMVTENPARWLDIYPHYGCLEKGSRADLVALNDQGDVLSVWVSGTPVAMA